MPSDAGSLHSLFAAGAPDVLSVAEVVAGLKVAVEIEYPDVWVEGELSNLSRPASGHWYFTLKDADAQIRCVLWRHFAQQVDVEPQDGDLVRLRGSASLYEKRGDVQLIGRSLQHAGEGALQRAFEKLKLQLAEEGLFDETHKQSLPPFPERLGVITSGTGAALRDILSTIERRFPQVYVFVCPVLVQGDGAAPMIAEAIDAFSAIPEGDPLRVDALIVGRGGGSTEDLWAFNEEAVARAIFRSTIPIVSAVGHETDVSIADFVADVRAATPTMAAELCTPDHREIRALVRGLHEQLDERMRQRLADHRRHVEHLTASHAFNRPLDRLRQAQQRVDEVTHRLHQAARIHLRTARRQAEALDDRLRLVDPRRPLNRGYARVERDDTPIRTAADLAPGDVVRLHFADGTRDAEIRD